MDTSLSRLLSRISIAHRTASEKALSTAGLHAGQANLLFCLWEKDGKSQAELTRELCVAPPTVNVLVSKLEKQGLVISRECPDDGRLKRIHLTEVGKRKRIEAESVVIRLEDRTLHGLSDIERNTAFLILEKIYANLVESENDSET